jgi:hypothetical protein
MQLPRHAGHLATGHGEVAARGIDQRDRDAVHHHAVERRLVALGQHMLAQHAAGGGIQRHALGREQRQAGANPTLGFGDAWEFAHGVGKPSVRGNDAWPRLEGKAWGRGVALTTAAKVEKRMGNACGKPFGAARETVTWRSHARCRRGMEAPRWLAMMAR